MAQLKDLIVTGVSRLIGDAYTNKIQITTLNAPTSSGGTTYGAGSNGQVLKSNGSSIYWAADNNSDVNVTQTITTGNANYRLLFSNTADDTTRTEAARKAAALYYNPSTKLLTISGGQVTATTFSGWLNGTATTATQATHAATANSATTATEATHAATANSATTAGFATTASQATHAATANSATTATQATHSATADSATWATNLAAYSSNEVTIGGSSGVATNDSVWINYRSKYGGSTSDTATQITHYYFGNRKGNTNGVTVHAANFDGNASTATTAGFATTASQATHAATANTATTASNAVTAGFATTASQATHAATANSATTASQATHAATANTASTAGFATTAANATLANSVNFLANKSGSTVTIANSSWTHGQTGAYGTNTSATAVWSQKWTQSGLTYTPSGGTATTLSDSGDIVYWLSQSANSNNLAVNMAIDGIIYSLNGFKGNLTGTASNATTAGYATTASQATHAATANSATTASQATHAATANFASTANFATTATKAAAANITTTVNAIAKYSTTTGTFANSGVTIDSSNNINTSGSITASGNILGGGSTQTSERQIGVQSTAGKLYFYSHGTTTGNRGIYTFNNAGTATSVLSINQNNTITLYGNANTATTATNATNIYSAASTSKAYVLGTLTASSAMHGTVYNASVYTQGSVLFGAAWNDYAEYREVIEPVRPGQCVVENNNDTMSISTARMQPGAEIVSDTYGFAIGETNKASTPIAVTGRVLAYPYEPREQFKPGRPVCSGPNGTVSLMTDAEAREYPWCIIGTVSAVPDYEYWGPEDVKVNGRIWIRIR